MIYDFKGRRYSLDGVCSSYTYMTCLKTGANIKIANTHFTACGFSSDQPLKERLKQCQ